MLPLLQILFVTALAIATPTRGCFSNISHYSAIEQLVMMEENLESLAAIFFPTNEHRSLVVNITYHFRWTNQEVAEDNQTLPQATFQWLSSPIHLSINSQLLTGLSLRTYATEVQSGDLMITTSCDNRTKDIKIVTDSINKAKATHNTKGSQLIKLLTKLTANVSFTVLSPQSMTFFFVSYSCSPTQYIATPCKQTECHPMKEDFLYSI